VRHLDTIDIQRRMSDQLFREKKCVRRIFRLNVDLMLKAFEVMAVGVQQILVEGDTVVVHDTSLVILKDGCAGGLIRSPSRAKKAEPIQMYGF
jgi:hypothetical protein